MMKKLIKNILKEYNEKHIWNNNNLIHNVKPNTKTLRQIWDEIEVGKVYKIYGIYTANFIDWALEDQRVEVMDKDHRLLTVKVLDKIQMGAGQFRPGSRMFLTMGDDGDRVYITPVNDMVEGDDGLDWIKDIPVAKWDDDWKPEDLVNKNLKVKTNGNEWRIVGGNPTNKNTLIIKNLSSWQERELHFNTLRNWVKTGDVVFFELSENTVNENSEWGWVDDIELTLEDYHNNGLLVPGKLYNLKGKWSGWSVNGGDIFINLPKKGITVKYESFTHGLIEFEVMKTFRISGLRYPMNRNIYLDIKSDAPYLYVNPLENVVNESEDFDWVSNIKPEIDWDNIKPEDLVGRNFILIDRNRVYTVEGYNKTTGQFNIHNHETNKEHRLSLSEIESLIFMGDIKFDV